MTGGKRSLSFQTRHPGEQPHQPQPPVIMNRANSPEPTEWSQAQSVVQAGQALGAAI